MASESNIHSRIYDLTCKINKLLSSSNISQLQEVLKERGTLINSLKDTHPPGVELSKKIVELESKNKSLLEKKIQEQEQAINNLQLAKKTLVKYRVSNKAGKLLNIKR